MGIRKAKPSRGPGSWFGSRDVKLWFKPGGSPDRWSKKAIQGEKGRDQTWPEGRARERDGYPVLDSSHGGGSDGSPGLRTRRNCKLDNYLCRLSGPLPTYSGSAFVGKRTWHSSI